MCDMLNFVFCLILFCCFFFERACDRMPKKKLLWSKIQSKIERAHKKHGGTLARPLELSSSKRKLDFQQKVIIQVYFFFRKQTWFFLGAVFHGPV